MDEQIWTGVRERVLALGLHLEDPLSPEELADLEATIGVRLPEEYRGFLLHVGAGGAGPSYGVFPVRKGEDGTWEWDGDGGDMTLPDRLAEPFDAVGPDPEVLADLEAGHPEEEDFDDIEEYDAAYEAWEERLMSVLWTDERTVGAICLCHLGCAQRQWLVVSGPERGRMWDDARCDHVDLEPLNTGFAEWYLSWLRDARPAPR
ncbi:SMI1/KNR4 family protein [Streptomyces coeruleoprunus]|uniref:SMI1/KNR4 family protein n=1 Tax=Streptomyces coeruleoprunus TaxID=285563 RepID=A0ABV9XAM3_9ACTN